MLLIKITNKNEYNERIITNHHDIFVGGKFIYIIFFSKKG